MERQPIRIPLNLINKVTKEDTDDSLRALAFTVMVKASFVSSTFKDADTTSLMSFFHLKHSTLKKALNKALQMGLVEYIHRTDRNGVQHTDLLAKKMSIDGVSTVKLKVCSNSHGRAVYIHTNLKDLHKQYQSATSFQTINDVMDMLITAKAISLFKRHNKVLDCQLRQACLDISPNEGEKLYRSAKSFSQYVNLYRDMQDEIPIGKINILNSGFSLESILSNFGSFVSRYKMRKLLHKADQLHDRLLHVLCNHAYINQKERLTNFSHELKKVTKETSPMEIFQIAYDNYDAMRGKGKFKFKAYSNRFTDVNEIGETINLYKDRGCFISKEHTDCLVKPMANTYFMQCDPFVKTGKKHRRVKRTAAPKAKAVVAPSVESHVCIDALPY